MVVDLAGQQVRHLAGPDDDDVLDVGGVPPSEDAHDRAEQRNQDDRDPQEYEAREVRMREADDLGDRDEARSDRHHLEDAEDVVDRQMIVRSSSRSYSPCILARSTQSGRLATKARPPSAC